MWKPVPIEGANINDIEGLLGIEVWDDGSDKIQNNKGQKKKKRKRKVLPVSEEIPSEPGRYVKIKRENCNEDDDDNSFLNEMKAWKGHGIRKELLRALHDKGYLIPTHIQEKCIHGAVTSKKADIVGAAETGSGKTYAYGIPVIQQIIEEQEKANSDEDKGLAAVVMTPTRELAVQVKNHLSHLCKYTNIRIALVVGGLSIEKQERILNKKPEILVGTPGRIWQLFKEKNPHILTILKVRMLVVDEADRMLEQKHFLELGELLDIMNSETEISERRRNFVFSATLTIVHEPPSYHKGKKMKPKKKLNELLGKIGVKTHLVYDLTAEKVTPATLSEWKIQCQFIEKDYYLLYFLLKNRGRCIIFCNSIGCVRRLANILNILQFKPLPLHANMEQKQRLRNLEKFQNNENALLLATDVAARGLDIPKVGHVVHYQVPRTAETYVHRSGRTARGTNQGASLVLVSVEESRSYLKLMKTLKRDHGLEEYGVSANELNQVKKIVHLARDIDQITLKMRRLNSHEKWYNKAVEEMDLYLEEDELPQKLDDHIVKKLKTSVKKKEHELKDLLSQPIAPHGFSGKFPDVNRAIV